MAARAKAEHTPQTSMHERIVDDPDLLEQCAIFVETKSAVKKHVSAKKAIDSRLETMSGIKNGITLRVGPYVIPIVARAGGGFQVARWEKNAAGKILDTAGTNAGPPPTDLDF